MAKRAQVNTVKSQQGAQSKMFRYCLLKTGNDCKPVSSVQLSVRCQWIQFLLLPGNFIQHERMTGW